MINYLYVGSFIERKNVKRMLKAFSMLMIPFKLTVVNRSKENVVQFKQWLKDYKLKNRVIFKPDLSFTELLKEYKKADVFVYVTLNEGFGLPLVEAMSLGVPILTSRLPVHLEITKEHQYYVDPTNAFNILQGLKGIGEDQALRQKLSNLGKIDSLDYSNEKYIKEVLEVVK